MQTYLTILGNLRPESGGLGAFLSLKSQARARPEPAQHRAASGKGGEERVGSGVAAGTARAAWLRQASHTALTTASAQLLAVYRF